MAAVRRMAVPVGSGSGSDRFAGKTVQAVHTQKPEIPKTAKSAKKQNYPKPCPSCRSRREISIGGIERSVRPNLTLVMPGQSFGLKTVQAVRFTRTGSGGSGSPVHGGSGSHHGHHAHRNPCSKSARGPGCIFWTLVPGLVWTCLESILGIFCLHYSHIINSYNRKRSIRIYIAGKIVKHSDNAGPRA